MLQAGAAVGVGRALPLHLAAPNTHVHPTDPPPHTTPARPFTLQIQSNALGALEALDEGVAQRVFEEGCITGDRINGLCDGVTGDWCVAARATRARRWQAPGHSAGGSWSIGGRRSRGRGSGGGGQRAAASPCPPFASCSLPHVLLHARCVASIACRYIKFDTFHPAVDMGLPVTRVISRITLQVGKGAARWDVRCRPQPLRRQATAPPPHCWLLVPAPGQPRVWPFAACRRAELGLAVVRHCAVQEILADACREIAGEDVIQNSVNIVDYEQGVDPATGKKVRRGVAQARGAWVYRRYTRCLLPHPHPHPPRTMPPPPPPHVRA